MSPVASAVAAPPRAIRQVLSNGMVLVVRENHANPTVAVQGLVKAGAIFDPPRRAGLAAFAAAMLDQGTATRSAFEQAAAVEDLGATLRFEGGSETVSIHGSSLAGDLEALLASLAEAVRDPAFPDQAIEKVRGELINEFKVAENSTSSVAVRRANEILYPEGHPYHDPPGGTEASLRAIGRGDLVSFHQSHYAPDATVLVLVGDVTPERAARAAEAVVGNWRRGAPPPFQVPPARDLDSARRLTVPRPGKSQADIVYAVPGIARTAPDYDATMIMSYVLGGGSLSSRLMDSLRDRQGLVYGVYSGLHSGIGAGPFQIRAGTNPGNVQWAIEAILSEVRRMHDEGPLDDEIEAAKDFLTGVFPVRLETNTAVAHQLLSAELYGLGLDYIERYPSIVRAITTDQVRAAARAHLDPDAYALVVAGPFDPAEDPGAP